MEVARAWVAGEGNLMPEEVSRLLRTHPDFGEVLSWSGEPEAKLPFDAFPGEPRNTDIAVIAEDRHGKYVLAIEAKADEPFAETVADTLAQALERKLLNVRSNGIARVEQLTTAILGPRQSGEPQIGQLRYQLLTATAGALCEAQRRGFERAVLLVHEFVTVKTSDEKHRMNTQDLQRFLTRLAHGKFVPSLSSSLAGPFLVPGSPLLKTAVRLYVGKVTRNLRNGA
jgi:hypothetical protein